MSYYVHGKPPDINWKMVLLGLTVLILGTLLTAYIKVYIDNVLYAVLGILTGVLAGTLLSLSDRNL